MPPPDSGKASCHDGTDGFACSPGGGGMLRSRVTAGLADSSRGVIPRYRHAPLTAHVRIAIGATARRWLLPALAVLMAGAANGRAQSANPDARTLRGIRNVYVLVEHLDESTVRQGVDSVALRTLLELKLREHGIIVPDANGLHTAVLYLQVSMSDALSDGAIGYAIVLDLQQDAVLDRPDKLWVPDIVTWSAGMIGVARGEPMGRAVRDATSDQMDKFLNDWLSVNSH